MRGSGLIKSSNQGGGGLGEVLSTSIASFLNPVSSTWVLLPTVIGDFASLKGLGGVLPLDDSFDVGDFLDGSRSFYFLLLVFPWSDPGEGS
ncbi:hypothetical protein Tco_0995542 [Tanacetum coccineum]